MENTAQFRQMNSLMPFPQRLMIIEDDLTLSEVLANIFTDHGYHCGLATDAPEISAIEAFKPDLIIIDYHLPKVNGGEVCAALKTNRLLAAVPIIVISAYSSIFLNLDGYEFDGFIEKPFSVAEIVTPVRNLLHQKQIQGKRANKMPFYLKPWQTDFH